MTRPVVLFDLDGTIADNRHRQHFVTQVPKNWDAFFDAQHLDTPNKSVVALYNALRASEHFQLIVVTARPERYRNVSEQWFASNDICLDRLIMRVDGDRRSDELVKKEILETLRLEGLNPILAIDDRGSVVQMWRDEGLTCFQCADHNF